MLGVEGGGIEELQLPPGALCRLRKALRERGYGAVQPGAQGWGAAHASLVALELGARRLAQCGYPPVFIFAFDQAWEVLDRLWEPMQATLGEGCAMDPSTFCWIARSGGLAPAAAPAAAATRVPTGVTTGATAGAAAAAAAVAAAVDDNYAPAAAGANFGMPHRDFTCLQSLDKDGACGRANPGAPWPRTSVLPRATPTPAHPIPHLLPNAPYHLL